MDDGNRILNPQSKSIKFNSMPNLVDLQYYKSTTVGVTFLQAPPLKSHKGSFQPTKRPSGEGLSTQQSSAKRRKISIDCLKASTSSTNNLELQESECDGNSLKGNLDDCILRCQGIHRKPVY